MIRLLWILVLMFIFVSCNDNKETFSDSFFSIRTKTGKEIYGVLHRWGIAGNDQKIILFSNKPDTLSTEDNEYLNPIVFEGEESLLYSISGDSIIIYSDLRANNYDTYMNDVFVKIQYVTSGEKYKISEDTMLNLQSIRY